MTSGRTVRGRMAPLAAVLAVTLGLGGLVSGPPAGADVTGVSPASREADPGGATTATITVTSDIPTCVSGRPSDPRLAPTFSTTCDDETTWRTTMTVQVPDEPGIYSVEIGDDRSNVTRRFELRVRAPAPPPTPPPPPSTTSTFPATTTTRPPTTTTAPTTTSAPAETTTTTAAATTTTLAPPPPGGGFVSVAALVDQGVPARGVFLPLTDAGYRRCLPLTAACVVEGSGLIVVPARTTELAWPALADDAVVPPRLDLRGVAPLQPVGRAPEDPGAQDYALPLLDLAAAGGQLRTLVRGLDAEGRLLTPRGGGGPVAAPRAEGPMAAPEADTALASTPFGRPEPRTRDDFTEAAPAVVLFSATQLQVVYAIRPIPAWGLDVELLPLFSADAVPYLVRGVDGPPGLYVALPDGVRVPDVIAAGPDEVAADDSDGGGVPAVALLGGAVGAGAVLTGALAWRRRRRPPVDQ